MSMAPANRASIAEGPALKLVHSTLTWGPIAFSNQPFALPTIAWGWLIFGNAPTRMTVCAKAPTVHAVNINSNVKRVFLIVRPIIRCGSPRHVPPEAEHEANPVSGLFLLWTCFAGHS